MEGGSFFYCLNMVLCKSRKRTLTSRKYNNLNPYVGKKRGILVCISIFPKDFTLGLFLMAESMATVIPGIMSSPWSFTPRMGAEVQSELFLTAYVFSESFS